MRKTLAGVLAIVLVTMTLLVTVLDDSDTTGRGKPGACHSASAPGAEVPEGVPAGSLSRPMRSSDAQVSDTFRPPDRPDHQGVDLAGPQGAPIFAMADGVVAAAGEASGFGQWIVIDHMIGATKYSTVYGHMWPEGRYVEAGETVTAGQHVADEGAAGKLTGPHLHFEVWEGGRFTGGTPVDPMPWIERAAEPGTGSTEAPESSTPLVAAAPPASGSEMPPAPGDVEQHLQIDTIRVARAVHARFPQITTFHGWRPSDRISQDHPSGLAVDVMIPDYDTDNGRQLGDSIRDYLFTHREYLQIDYMIWRQTYIPSSGASNLMEDRGDSTANHYDHVHITTFGHGLPSADQNYGPAPELDGSIAPPDPAKNSCLPFDAGVGEHTESELVDTRIPEEFKPWLVLSARQCQELTPQLLAAQLYQESGFRKGQRSPTGASGYAQFMPGTWASFGYPVDEHGNRTGPAGAGDPDSIGDAVMAQGAYNCHLADQVRPQIATGQITGDPVDLMLAAYNAGPGNVEKYGGIPPFAETQAYVAEIQKRAREMTGVAQ
ncbi:M23 family metallopeptidase [Nocardia asiatica]|uniref:M23 family metallopeptidase n=1 Tax=Nocardia asiatica TaxID=209252 RepID=UPI0005C13B4E|nr:M23 family metallopeptidase [Nocardia asiatica]